MIKLKVLVESQVEATLLMRADAHIWDKLHARDGGDIQRKWKQYVSMVKDLMKGKKISKHVYKELENENHHSMNKALEELGLVEK